MTHLITQSCCNDAACVPACPVNCIHPTPEDPEFATADMLFIDPATCIDCGACVPECPVDAIVPDTALPADAERFRELNAAYYRDHDVRAGVLPFRAAEPPRLREARRVAVVGAGPAGLYTAQELLTEPNVEVDVIDRLPTPLGLIRAGVAPDHQRTKKVGDVLGDVALSPRFRYVLGVEVGRHVSVAELAAGYDAVVFAHGAADPKSLGLEGEELSGSVSSTEFVAWYNGHPDFADREFDLSGERVAVVGNGNVALDVARMLLSDPEELARTDIADHALAALRRSSVREVVLLARRGIGDVACTIGELAGLESLPGVQIVLNGAEQAGAALESPKTALLRDLAAHAPQTPSTSDDCTPKRLVFRFHARPIAILGAREGHVTGVEVQPTASISTNSRTPTAAPTSFDVASSTTTDLTATLDTPLLIRSIGYAGRPLDGLPFDSGRALIPNRDGRVLDPATDEPVPGVYVAGWIKRGARGGIGTNRRCAEDTVRVLIDDLAAGPVPRPPSPIPLPALARSRGATVIDADGWAAINAAERAAGEATGRPRIKLLSDDKTRAAGQTR